MSNFSWWPALQMPKKTATGGWAHGIGQDCLLCAGASGDRVVCTACEAAMPTPDAACVRCAIALPRAGICGECLAHPFAFDDALARFEYRFPLNHLVQRFKYAGDLAAGRWLAGQLARCVHGERPDLIVAPPLTAAGLARRGFNQALELAKGVGRRLRVPCDIDGLHKERDTAPQPGLGRRERRANLRGAFRCDLRLHDLHVALVDDVMTTGATADTLARLLKRAGARRVSVWALARTPG
jgi:ComF family protein